MRFNIAMLFAFAATTQLAVAAPTPQWNSKDMETVYKAGSRICAGAGTICKLTGHDTAGNALIGAAAGFGAAEVAVTGSQGVRIPQAANAIGHGVAVVGNSIKNGGAAVANGIAKGGAAIGSCVGDLCAAGYRAATAGRERPNDVEMGHGAHHRRAVEIREEAAPLLSRNAQPELEAREASWEDLY